MMENEQTVHKRRRCIVGEIVFPMQMWISFIQVNEDDVDEFTVDHEGGFILDESIDESELELRPVPVRPPEEAQEEKERYSPMQAAKEEEPVNEDAGERFLLQKRR